jgi:high-affinity iron transporter
MFTAVAVQSGIIVLREGLEVVVVLAAMASLLLRQAPGRLGSLWIGAGLGLVASLLAVLYATHAPAPADAGVERLASLLAGGLMLWLGGWLWRQADPWRWSGALERTTRRAPAPARHVPLALGGIGFLTTFREGAETALFLSALGREHAAEALWGGVLVALAILLGLWWLSLRTAVRLPLRLVFQATSIFLLVTAVQLLLAGLWPAGDTPATAVMEPVSGEAQVPWR